MIINKKYKIETWNSVYDLEFPTEYESLIQGDETILIDSSGLNNKYYVFPWYYMGIKINGFIPRLFQGNKKLETIILNPFIKSIPSGSFDGCVNLEYIYIPKSIKYIPANLFKDCKQLRRVYYEGSSIDYKNIKIDEEGNSSFIKPVGRIFNKKYEYNPFENKNIDGYIDFVLALFGEHRSSEANMKYTNEELYYYVDELLSSLSEVELNVIKYRFNLENEYKEYSELDKIYNIDSKEVERIAIREMRNPNKVMRLKNYLFRR